MVTLDLNINTDPSDVTRRKVLFQVATNIKITRLTGFFGLMILPFRKKRTWPVIYSVE